MSSVATRALGEDEKGFAFLKQPDCLAQRLHVLPAPLERERPQRPNPGSEDRDFEQLFLGHKADFANHRTGNDGRIEVAEMDGCHDEGPIIWDVFSALGLHSAEATQRQMLRDPAVEAIP